MITINELNEIEAQLDSTVPHYVPRLIAEIRRLHEHNAFLGKRCTAYYRHLEDIDKLIRNAVSALLLVLCLASSAAAQDVPIGGILKSVALDPTTYAPAVVYRAGLRADWNTSRPLFDRGYVELNPDFTVSGRPGDIPVNQAVGYAKIDRFALRLLVDSAVHNLASHSVERMLIRARPQHRTWWKVIGIAERVAVGSYLAYINSAKHFEQAGRNRQTLERISR